MSGEVFEGFSGYGFSLKDEKGRFAIPVDFRADLRLSSDSKTVCLDIHPEWECVSAFGISRKRDFNALIEQARQDALAAGKPFDRLTWQAQFKAFDKVAFDDSGRFIMPPDLVETYEIDDALYWHSLGDHIAIFTPATLYERGPEFMRARCRRLEREARAKAAAKGGAK